MKPSLETCAQLAHLFQEHTDDQLRPNNDAKVCVLLSRVPVRRKHAGSKRLARLSNTQFALVGLARELRGVLIGANSRSTYMQAFDRTLTLVSLTRSLRLWGLRGSCGWC